MSAQTQAVGLDSAGEDRARARAIAATRKRRRALQTLGIRIVSVIAVPALSWAAVSISLPFRRAATTLLVPTSRPTGFEPAFMRSSMRSSASCATFQR